MNAMPKHLVCLSSTGGTGKTTVMDGVRNVCKKNNLPVAFMPSVMREFYALQGMESEYDYLKLSVKEKNSFEIEKIKFYELKINEFVGSCDEPIIVSDRSVVDFLAYGLVQLAPMQLSPTRSDITNAAMVAIGVWRAVSKVDIITLPYPTPWVTQTNDGFRAVDMVKDEAVHACILAIIKDIESIAFVNRTVGIHHLQTFDLNQRVLYVVTKIKHILKTLEAAKPGQTPVMVADADATNPPSESAEPVTDAPLLGGSGV